MGITRENSRDSMIRKMAIGEVLKFKSSERSAIYTSIYRSQDFHAPEAAEYKLSNDRKNGILTVKRIR